MSDSDSEGGGFESHRADQTNTPYASRTGYLFGLYGDNRTRSAMLYGFAEAKFLQGKNERSLEQTKISGTVTTVEILRSAEYSIGHKFKNPYTRTHRVRGICLVCMVIIEPVVHSTTGSPKRSLCKAKTSVVSSEQKFREP